MVNLAASVGYGDSSERYRIECEARQWISLVERNGFTWWQVHKEKLIKIRGKESVQRLIDVMTTERDKVKNANNTKRTRPAN